MTAHRPLLAALIVAGLLLGAAPAAAQMYVTTGKDTLRGLPGVEVVVDELPEELRAAGHSAQGLRTAIAARLRKAGLTVFASQKANTSDAKPYLYVLLNGFPIPGETTYAMSVQVQVRQTVRSVVTSSSIVDAVTWDSHDVVGVPTKELPRVTDVVLEHVERFVRDWTSTRQEKR